jgi:hypothetical protein
MGNEVLPEDHEAWGTCRIKPKQISVSDIFLHKEYELYKRREDYQAEMPDHTGIRPFYPAKNAMFATD